MANSSKNHGENGRQIKSTAMALETSFNQGANMALGRNLGGNQLTLTKGGGRKIRSRFADRHSTHEVRGRNEKQRARTRDR